MAGVRTISLDAMGGDRGPAVVVPGAALALRSHPDVNFLLVGDRARIEPYLAEHPALGTASTVGGGGRYDKLVRELGGPEVPAVGFALGFDRLVLLLKESGRSFGARPDVFVAVADDAARDVALKLVSSLRREGFQVETDPRGGSLKSQLKRADKAQARFALVLGENEVNSGAIHSRA